MRIVQVLAVASLSFGTVFAASAAPRATAGKPAAAMPQNPVCEDQKLQMASNGAGFGARPLNQDPDARHIKAVVRVIDGCSQPIVLREKVSGRGR
ncbi:MAG: hypothetical protein BVN32_00975 [Proteobacteria bacterium ST_bin14]|nr:MAG: hypothetical protein BVN32_00975 [Proteobacteria bacterium ST_bin14]